MTIYGKQTKANSFSDLEIMATFYFLPYTALPFIEEQEQRTSVLQLQLIRHDIKSTVSDTNIPPTVLFIGVIPLKTRVDQRGPQC